MAVQRGVPPFILLRTTTCTRGTKQTVRDIVLSSILIPILSRYHFPVNEKCYTESSDIRIYMYDYGGKL